MMKVILFKRHSNAMFKEALPRWLIASVGLINLQTGINVDLTCQHQTSGLSLVVGIR